MVHPDDRETVESQSQAFIDGVGGDLADYRMVRPDGGIVWVRDRAYAHRDDDGRVLWEHGILFDVTELKEAEARIAHMAFHDGLTGMANRELFEETLALAVQRAKRDGSVVAVLYLDLDNFKLVNDSLGHHAGDRLLIQLADRLGACTRDTDLVARQGGDEFLMLLADLGQADYVEAIRAVTDRVYEAMAAPFDLEGTEFFARGSIGISVHPHDAHDVETLMRNADVAMYRAKRLDPGGHAFFAADADDAQDRLSFATRLRQAVEDESWLLHYQPVVDLADRRIVGAEALIRWDDVAAGIVPPGEFIPVAEELGLIEAIGDWVVDEVARQQRRWIDAGLQPGGLVQPVATADVDAPSRRAADRQAPRRGGRPFVHAGRDHRDQRDGRPRADPAHPARAPRVRSPARARRLRYRVLLARALEAHAGRRVEDRPRVRAARRP